MKGKRGAYEDGGKNEKVLGDEEPLRKSSWYNMSTSRQENVEMLPRHSRQPLFLSTTFELVALALLVIVIQVAAVFTVVLRSGHAGGGGDDGPVPAGLNALNNAVSVNLTYTTYQGTRLTNGVNEFLGMRYAAPPLGDLRWRAPVEPYWSNRTERATKFPPICLGINQRYPADGQSEDCLFVNVWAPANATRQSKLPVWVFIQGGGYNANTNGNWNGSEVVEKSGHNLILVNFNYRVGIWGFLAGERVRADGVLNAGLLDQRMLLKWVKTHISSFGGDPTHVVIHGASAGAGSVAMHLIAYGGRDDNLFVGGMAESIFFPAQPFLSELEYQFDRVVNQAGCDQVGKENQMACLRQKPPDVLQGANYAQPFPGKPGPPNPIFYFTPCIDGDILPDLPYQLFGAGKFIQVPMLFGTATNEGSVFADNSTTRSSMGTFFENNYPLLTQDDIESIFARYPQLPMVPNHATWFPTTSQAYGDATFICPQTNVLNSLSGPRHHLSSSSSWSNKTNTTTTISSSLYAYRYNVHDKQNMADGLGVPHLFDAAAIFGPDNISGGHTDSYKTYNKDVVSRVMSYYISFVRTLDPNPLRLRGTPEWETWRGNDDSSKDYGEMRRMLFETDDTKMESVSKEEEGRCRFWEGLGRGRMEQR